MMRLTLDLSNDFLAKVQKKIDETWDGMPPEYTKPDLTTVILTAFDSLAEWAADDASEMTKCVKIDSCNAEAIVLQELAALFRGIIL